MDKTVKPFSAGYFIVEAELLGHNRDVAIMARDFYDELTNYVTRPLLKSGTDHYWAQPEYGIPAQTVALPESRLPDEEGDQPVLLAKDETAYRLITAGEQERPA